MKGLIYLLILCSLTAITQLTHHGMIFVPIGYTFGAGMFEMEQIKGGSPYGSGTFAGDGSRKPSEIELGQAFHQGKYIATITKKLKATAWFLLVIKCQMHPPTQNLFFHSVPAFSLWYVYMFVKSMSCLVRNTLVLTVCSKNVMFSQKYIGFFLYTSLVAHHWIVSLLLCWRSSCINKCCLKHRASSSALLVLQYFLIKDWVPQS